VSQHGRLRVVRVVKDERAVRKLIGIEEGHRIDVVHGHSTAKPTAQLGRSRAVPRRSFARHPHHLGFGQFG
jgi:hypothetical protein